MTDKEVDYKGYIIKPKRDFPSYGFLINGKRVHGGFVVTNKHNINVMPAATWFLTIKEAKKGIDVLTKYGENDFWTGWKAEEKEMKNIDTKKIYLLAGDGYPSSLSTEYYAEDKEGIKLLVSTYQKDLFSENVRNVKVDFVRKKVHFEARSDWLTDPDEWDEKTYCFLCIEKIKEA